MSNSFLDVNLNLTDYENPFVVQLYSIVLDITFILSTPLFFLMIFLILKKSKGIGIYKFYMLYTFTASYVYDLVLMVSKPVPMFPLPVMAMDGLLKTQGSLVAHFQFTLWTVAIVHFVMALAQAIVYRYAQVFPGRIKDHVDSLRFKFGLLYFHIGLYAIFVAPTFFFFKSTEETRQSLSFLPNIDIWSNKTSLVYIPTSLYVDLYVYALIIGLGYTSVTTVILHVFYTFRFLKMLKKGSKKMKRMQLTLFKSLTIQITLATILLQIPAVTTTLLYKFQVKHSGTIGTICFMITSFHSSVEYLSLCYFMHPYKNFISTKLGQMFGQRFCTNLEVYENESTNNNNKTFAQAQQSIFIIRKHSIRHNII